MIGRVRLNVYGRRTRKTSKTMDVTNADQAYEKILIKIVKSEMEPGSVIEERLLMEELGFGRTPIREALKRLANERFISVRPRRGMFVEPITITDINRIYEIRYELEALCVRLAVKRVKPEQIVALKTLLERAEAAQMVDVEEIIEHDRKFHFKLYQCCFNNLLIKDLRKYYNMSQRIWYSGLHSLEPVKFGWLDHVELVKAIEDKDEDAADEIMRRHISDFQKNIQDYLY